MEETKDEITDVTNSVEFSKDGAKFSSKHYQRVSCSPHSRSRSRSRSSDSYHRHSRRHHSSRCSDSRSNSSRSSSGSYSRSGSRSRSRSRSCGNDGDFPEKDPRDRSMRHHWSNNVWLIGEKVKDLTFHICDICDKPIVIYGRLKPCNHVFCFTCALSLPGKCRWCEAPYVSCDRHLLGNIYQCTEDPKCRRTYMSQRDLEAHIKHRHKKLTKVVPPSTSNQVKTAPLPSVIRSPPQANYTSSSVKLQTNFSVPPPPSLLLSGGPPTNVPPPSQPHNALLVAPPTSHQMGRGTSNTGTGDFATIAALAAAIQANPNALAASLAVAGGLNVSQLCPPPPAGNFQMQPKQTFPQSQNKSPRMPDASAFWSSNNPQM
nr:zinc finger protein [Hymenolepis microstoma]